MKPGTLALLALVAATPALAAPKIESVSVSPSSAKFDGGKAPEVEVSVSVNRSRFDKAGCDVRVEFGDGEGRTLDFGVATKRSVHHVYKKGGSYSVVARGSGATPCEGTQQAALTVAAPPAPKKPEPKKAEKKAEPKKPAAKKAPAKKGEPKKPAAKKAPAKKAAEKKKDEKKDETK
jgi:hypothetical protein